MQRDGLPDEFDRDREAAEDRQQVIRELSAFLERELGRWDLNHGAQDRHLLAIGLAHALVNRAPMFAALRGGSRPAATPETPDA